MIVTVFGGSGFLGRHVVRLIARAGFRHAGTSYRLRVAVRRPEIAHFLQPMGKVGQIQPLRCDVTNDAAVTHALAGSDYAVNLIGILAESGNQRFDAIHAEAAGRIAGIAKAKGVRRFVHVSALGANPAARSRYARSKAAGEAAVIREFPEAMILRPSIMFGPEDSFFNRFANMARFSPLLPLIGGGKTRFQPVYVGDAASAVLAVLENPAAEGHLYELGGPRQYEFRELMEIVLRESGRQRGLLPIPFWLASLMGAAFGLLPGKILTLDQVRSLRTDNVVGANDPNVVGTLADLGISPTALEAVVPTYLWRFRKQGQFDHRVRA